MRLAALALAALSACAAPERVEPFALAPRPADPAFLSAVPAGGTAYSNDSLAALLARLMHETEWGAPVPRLLRFEGPVRVSLQGPGAGAYADFLDGFLAQLRAATGIDIARGPEPAQIHLHLVDGARYKSTSPSTACNIVFAQVGWEQYLAEREVFSADALVETETRREHATVFIPQTTLPSEVRGCLIEEVVQSLGPSNDLWGLAYSIFNDDEAHSWPTALDLLMLRVLYRPELVPGQDRAATEAGARAALRVLNPQGEAAPPLPALSGAELARWRRLINRSVAVSTTAEWAKTLRQAEAEVARLAPRSAEHCYTMAELGWLGDDREALAWLDRARAVCGTVYGAGDIRMAMIAYLRGLTVLRLDRPEEAMAEFAAALPPLLANGLEQDVARVLVSRAWAERALERREAAATWESAMIWARYALGADNPALADLQAEWDAGS